MVLRKLIYAFILCLVLTACQGTRPAPVVTEAAPASTAVPVVIPSFDHIVLILLENESFDEVIGNPEMPFLNELAQKNVLLSRYYAVAHPSLPNYLALIGGETFGVDDDCTGCFQDAPILPDYIEEVGRSWKAYQEDLPQPCFVGSAKPYVQRHNPFIYFDSVRLDSERCQRAIVPLSQLDEDLGSGSLPDFSFISPNLCHSGHDCPPAEVDAWLKQVVGQLTGAPALGQRSLIAIVYDEADESDESTCCGLSSPGGGRVAAVLVSSLAKPAFEDETPLTHYSLLKTILLSWGLPGLGISGDRAVQPISAPWKTAP